MFYFSPCSFKLCQKGPYHYFFFDFELRLFSEISWIFDTNKKKKVKKLVIQILLIVSSMPSGDIENQSKS